MFRITDRAANAVQDLLHTDHAQGRLVRLASKDTGSLGLQLDTVHPGDEVITRQQMPLVAVDRQLMESLSKSVLHFERVALRSG